MMTALGVFRAIRAAGLELGKDVSMIAHDDVFPYLNADNMVPSMSTTRSSMRAAGARIAELLLQMQEGKRPADPRTLAGGTGAPRKHRPGDRLSAERVTRWGRPEPVRLGARS